MRWTSRHDIKTLCCLKNFVVTQLSVSTASPGPLQVSAPPSRQVSSKQPSRITVIHRGVEVVSSLGPARETSHSTRWLEGHYGARLGSSPGGGLQLSQQEVTCEPIPVQRRGNPSYSNLSATNKTQIDAFSTLPQEGCSVSWALLVVLI